MLYYSYIHLYDNSSFYHLNQEVLAFLFKKISYYLDSKNGSCRVYPAPFAVKLFKDKKTIVEPDISVICDHEKLTQEGCSGSPDWIIEIISPSTSGHDYVRKLNLYMNAGVREYWIVDPLEKRIFVYYLEQTDYKVKVYTFDDKISVNLYDGFQIDFSEITGL